MDFPFQSCIVADESFYSHQVRELLAYHHGLTCILLDLKMFEEEMQKLGEEEVVAHNLSSQEQEHLGRLTSGKRKREWLGGRFAAKYVAAGMLDQNGNAISWSDLVIIADANGRPFLDADKNSGALPDISISHSGGLAAAMAVSKGHCGIDIQKVTDRVFRIRERFCTPAEEQILQSYFSTTNEKQTTVLTKLWAAKEAIRKVANKSSLPGFLELELTDAFKGSSHRDPGPWKFIFRWKHIDINGNPVTEKCSVAVSLIADYALALTARNDTVG